MCYVLIIILFTALLYVVLRARKQKEVISDLKEQIERQEAERKRFVDEKDLTWDQLNAIHLYASLSYEETKSKSLKAHQLEILYNAEAIMQTMQK